MVFTDGDPLTPFEDLLNAVLASIRPSAGDTDTFPTITVAGATYDRIVTFPVGRFSVAPAVSMSLMDSAGTTALLTYWHDAVTADGFVAHISRATGSGTFDFSWNAVEIG